MILVLDNHDSFTFNLVQYLRELGAEVHVEQSDAIDPDGILARRPARLLLSPGPGTPAAAGCCVAAVRALSGRLPILGVCLGHQAIAEAFGGVVGPARRIMHGHTSSVIHAGRGIFRGLPSPLTVGRYHSLAVQRAGLPAELLETATADDGELMALQHRAHPTFGIQFHPESILTPHGKALLARFLQVPVTIAG